MSRTSAIWPFVGMALMTLLLVLDGCERFFEFYGPGDDGGTRISHIVFASDSLNPLAAGPLPVYDRESSELWSVRPDGSGLQRLTANDLYDGQPSVSKDGRKVVFAGDSRVMTFAAVHRQLFVINADGTGERELALSSNADEYDPAISPDGKFVAFISDRDGNPDLYVGGLDGSAAIRMSLTDQEESSPAWSPDGNWIAVIRKKPGGDGAELWKYTNPTGPILGPPGPVNITALVGAKDPDFLKRYNRWASPDWSPDGRSIAFSADYEGMLTWYIPPHVFIVDLGTFTVLNPEDPTDRFVDYSIEEDPSFSPDGSQLVFSAKDPSAPKLVLVKLSGFRVGEIFLGGNRRCWQADWAPVTSR